MSNEEVRERPAPALKYFADKLTTEQFDYCVRKAPWTALEYCADKLTTEQKQYCKETLNET